MPHRRHLARTHLPEQRELVRVEPLLARTQAAQCAQPLAVESGRERKRLGAQRGARAVGGRRGLGGERARDARELVDRRDRGRVAPAVVRRARVERRACERLRVWLVRCHAQLRVGEAEQQVGARRAQGRARRGGRERRRPGKRGRRRLLRADERERGCPLLACVGVSAELVQQHGQVAVAAEQQRKAARAEGAGLGEALGLAERADVRDGRLLELAHCRVQEAEAAQCKRRRVRGRARLLRGRERLRARARGGNGGRGGRARA
jgi:hypothetical protein